MRGLRVLATDVDVEVLEIYLYDRWCEIIYLLDELVKVVLDTR